MNLFLGLVVRGPWYYVDWYGLVVMFDDEEERKESMGDLSRICIYVCMYTCVRITKDVYASR